MSCLIGVQDPGAEALEFLCDQTLAAGDTAQQANDTQRTNQRLAPRPQVFR
jgi:hypothetical protein